MKRRCTATMGAALTDLSKNQARVSVDHFDINNQVISIAIICCLAYVDLTKSSSLQRAKAVNQAPDKDYDMIIIQRTRKKNRSRNTGDNYEVVREASVSV